MVSVLTYYSYNNYIKKNIYNSFFVVYNHFFYKNPTFVSDLSQVLKNNKLISFFSHIPYIYTYFTYIHILFKMPPHLQIIATGYNNYFYSHYKIPMKY